MPRLDEYFLTELKNRNPIEETVSRYLTLKRAGRNLKGLCPFHNEKSPSFTLYPENGSFYCFGCGVGGDVISFTMRMENLDYMEAVRLLADRSGLTLPEAGVDDSQHRQRQRILEINRETARFFHAYLTSPQGKVGYEYIRGRQITDATIRRFGLGYAPDSWDTLYRHLRSKGYSDAELVDSGVCIAGKEGRRPYDRFRNRMVFPLIDLRGNVLAFSCRRIDPNDKGGKYINTNDTPVYKKSNNVFALNLAKKSGEKRLILCEGSMDVVMLHQAGFPTAVAAWGTALTREQARLMRNYADEIILTLDSDEAGQKATDRAIGILSAEGLDVKVVQIPDGKDPDEFIKNCGKDGHERFQALLEGAGSDTEYRLYKAMKGSDPNTNEGRAAGLQNAAEVLGSLPSAIERDVYAGRLAEQYGVSKEAILAEAKRTYERNARKRRQEEERQVTARPATDRINPLSVSNPRAANAEEGLLGVLLRNPDFLAKVREEISPDEFVTDFHRGIYERLLSRWEEGRGIDTTLLGGELSPEELSRLVHIQVRGSERANTLEECRLCISVIKEEKQRISPADSEQMSDEELRAYVQRLRDQKARGTKQ